MRLGCEHGPSADAPSSVDHRLAVAVAHWQCGVVSHPDKLRSFSQHASTLEVSSQESSYTEGQPCWVAQGVHGGRRTRSAGHRTCCTASRTAGGWSAQTHGRSVASARSRLPKTYPRGSLDLSRGLRRQCALEIVFDESLRTELRLWIYISLRAI